LEYGLYVNADASKRSDSKRSPSPSRSLVLWPMRFGDPPHNTSTTHRERPRSSLGGSTESKGILRKS